MSQTLSDIPNVEIDSEGRFKYIQIRLRLGEEEKYVVRGNKRGEYHADILDEFEKSLKNKEIRVDCVGGGRIYHEPVKTDIFVYGYSQV
jgi:phosphohistidine phosphatase